MGNQVKSSSVNAECGACGERFMGVAWQPGDHCPKCGSTDFAPFLMRSGASDYVLADRSKAYAIEDIRFGRLAQWAELVTPKQFQWALHQQKLLAAERKNVPDLAQILMDEKILTQTQIRRLMAVRRTIPGGRDDLEFAAAAKRLNLITPQQLEQCRILQEQAKAQGADPLPLPLLVYEKRFIPEKQVIALLQTGRRQGWGLLEQIQASEKSESEVASAVNNYLGQRGTMGRKARLVVAVLIPILLIVAAVRLVRGPVATATVQCIECLAIGGAPADSTWPIKCPECESMSMYPLAICLDCGKKYPLKTKDYGGGCPNCRSTRYILITNKVDLAKIEEEIKTKSERLPLDGEL